MERAGSSAFSLHAWKHLRKIKTADILVGITSHNNAHTINYVVYQAAKGLETYFSNLRSVIFVSDGNSTDGTLATVEALRFPFKVDVIPATYTGVSGKGSAVKAIFEAANFLKVKAVALVDSDLRSITPYWIHLLVSPTLAGTGFVTPFYVRHKYDGTITNFLCFPVTSSLYGEEIRQPIGGDFGLSIELVEELLESPLWQTKYVPRFGIDIFETHTALAKRVKVKQAFLGTKVHEAKDPATHLDSMFRQVVGSMFTCIECYEKVWKKIRGRRKVEIIGEKKYTGTPEAIQINLQNLARKYESGFDENKKIFKKILSNDIFRKVERIRKQNDAATSFSPETWAKIVFSFAADFKNLEQSKRERLIDALRILWIGKVTTYIKQTLDLDTTTAEKKIEEELRAFEKSKPYLIDIF